MSSGLYSGTSGLSLGTGLYRNISGLWSGASGLVMAFGGAGQTLSLDFLAGAPLDSQITFTRASTATFVGSDGLIQTAAVNSPRFDYGPVSLQPLGLLIEEQRTNSVPYSAQFDNVIWTKVASSVVANSATAPDGTSNADTLLDDATSGRHYIQQGTVVATTGVTFTQTVYLKNAGINYGVLNLYNSTANNYAAASFDLTTGAVANTAALGAGISIVSTSVAPAGNGWYRCAITVVAGTIAFNRFGVGLSATGAVGGTTGYPSYTGTGANGIYVWGAQLEAGTFPTSYIPTTGSQVTRAADVAVMTGANFSSWFNAAQGTFVASYETSPNVYATYIAASNGVVGQNSVHFDNDAGGSLMRAVYYSGSVAQAILSLGAYGTAGVVNTVASAYAANDFSASRNGGAVVTDTSGALPVSPTQFNIGADPSGAAVNVTNTHIRSVSYYNIRLPDAELQSLST